MRILLCSSYWPPKVLGGAELYAAELAQRLTARGHEVGVVTLDAPGERVVASLRSWPYDLETWRSQPAWKRAVFHAVDASYNPVIGADLRRVLRRWAPDVVHSHSVPGFSGAVLSLPARLGLAHVHTLHDYWLVCQRSSLVSRSGVNCATRCGGCRMTSGLRRAQSRLAFPHVVIAISAAVAREHCSFPQAAARMRVIRHARPQAPRLPRPARRHPVVFGYLGQLTEHKGVSTLLAALTHLPPGSAELVVAGKGPLAGEVARRTVSGVRPLGWVSGEEKEAFFAALDCLVVPSQWPEPSGLVVDEALARGIPVIGARAGGIPEAVPAAWHPFLFRPGDPVDLARALAQFVRLPAADEPAVAPTGPDWDEHLDLVLAAYRDARDAIHRS